MGATASVHQNAVANIESWSNSQLVDYVKNQGNIPDLAEWIKSQGWTGTQALKAPGENIPKEWQPFFHTCRQAIGNSQEEQDKPLKVSLKQLPEALESAVYVFEKQPLVIDPSGQAARFFKYQRGSFLSAGVQADMDPENLRKCLIGALKHGSTLSINLDLLNVEISDYFNDTTFPSAILKRQELFKQKTWEALLRPVRFHMQYHFKPLLESRRPDTSRIHSFRRV